MKKDLKKSDWTLIGIVGFLSLLLMGRGLVALVTGVYASTARYSGPYELHDAAARFTGTGFIGLGLIVLCGIGFHLQISKRIMTLACGSAFLLTVSSFIMSFVVG